MREEKLKWKEAEEKLSGGDPMNLEIIQCIDGSKKRIRVYTAKSVERNLLCSFCKEKYAIDLDSVKIFFEIICLFIAISIKFTINDYLKDLLRINIF